MTGLKSDELVRLMIRLIQSRGGSMDGAFWFHDVVAKKIPRMQMIMAVKANFCK
jgi:hypothetical protein